MDTYLAIMVTVLVLTQVIRITQNAISLIRNNRLLKKQLASISDITDSDLQTQRDVYRMLASYLRVKMAGVDDGR